MNEELKISKEMARRLTDFSDIPIVRAENGELYRILTFPYEGIIRGEEQMGNKRIHGRCGNCGGTVSTPEVYMSTEPPVPTCEKCGAQQERTDLPTLEMGPPAKISPEGAQQS